MTLNKAEQFFFDHAGYSVAPDETEQQGKERGAKRLATDEAAAHAAGFFFRWSIDPYVDSSEVETDAEPHSVWQCVMYNERGQLVNSLHGIDFGVRVEPWGQPYRRVVEAELAGEGMTNEPQGKAAQQG